MFKRIQVTCVLSFSLLAFSGIALADSYAPAQVFCHESGGSQNGFLNVQPQVSAAAGTSVAFAFFIYNWNGQAWTEQGWTETFVREASAVYPPQRLSVPVGYHRVVTRYWWAAERGWSEPVDVETTTFSQMHYSPSPSQNPIQQAPQKNPIQQAPLPPDLPPEIFESDRCYTD